MPSIKTEKQRYARGLKRRKEVLMLAAIYCGVPAANTAFAHSRKLIGP